MRTRGMLNAGWRDAEIVDALLERLQPRWGKVQELAAAALRRASNRSWRVRDRGAHGSRSPCVRGRCQVPWRGGASYLAPWFTPTDLGG